MRSSATPMQGSILWGLRVICCARPAIRGRRHAHVPHEVSLRHGLQHVGELSPRLTHDPGVPKAQPPGSGRTSLGGPRRFVGAGPGRAEAANPTNRHPSGAAPAASAPTSSRRCGRARNGTRGTARTAGNCRWGRRSSADGAAPAARAHVRTLLAPGDARRAIQVALRAEASADARSSCP